MKIYSVPTLLIGASMALLPAALCAQVQPVHSGSAYVLSSALTQDKTESGIQNSANPVASRNPNATDNDDFSAMDKHFLKESAMGNMAEIKMGHLAADKGGTEAVKNFGNTMIQDHTNLADAMKPFMEKANVPVPDTLSPKDQALYDKLNSLSGKQFDTVYTKAMVNDHTKDKMAFDKELHSTKNADLKNAVQQGDKVITHHLQMAHKLASSNDKSDEPGQSGQSSQ